MIQPDPMLLASLQKQLAQMPLSVDDAKAAKLVALVQFIHKWNKAYNLTSVRDPNEMLVKHILDSIVVAPYLLKKRYIDVGTGPGLPGLPLAIMLPDTEFVLLDSLGKRIRFIKQACHELGIENVEAVQARVEDYQGQAPFDGVLSRAFASLKDMLHWCQHLVDSEGAFLALKGQFPAEELDHIGGDFRCESVTPLEVPGLQAERHLVTLYKN
ncbi:16S rRNA (guanine(527)-N(7))-methyltransferase RsmG [Aliiglaciecola sp. CAU 1673]|uniref:16S rRNA (guanine(527)-N(7))-methyltransferase RsmG n=1 Tax=Aliiglaciecola sp. CAU 1673 TaxID=3032595 RepID=UPI0023D9A25A|nr:16S rRNA (guanine(527)-N(7))-methyltransferase RsmG [Aliiglaciecola sp. CAU 1673]MDF2179718.1 16S rRNA (guanine(527)-N(7))-methyltransferase RsmG [Aliiglaciecola sp. CAU 1673]